MLTACVAGVLLGSEDGASCFNRNLRTSLPSIKMIPVDCLFTPVYLALGYPSPLDTRPFINPISKHLHLGIELP